MLHITKVLATVLNITSDLYWRRF